METNVSPSPAIETIENGESINVQTNSSATVLSVVVLDDTTVIKHETNGTSNHVAITQVLEMPPEDPGDIEGTDEEDILEIYTGRPRIQSSKSTPGHILMIQ